MIKSHGNSSPANCTKATKGSPMSRDKAKIPAYAESLWMDSIFLQEGQIVKKTIKIPLDPESPEPNKVAKIEMRRALQILRREALASTERNDILFSASSLPDGGFALIAYRPYRN